MTGNGFLEQRPRSPLSFGAVLLLHGAAIAGVLTIKHSYEVRTSDPTDMIMIDPVEVPPPEAPPPPPRPERQQVEPQQRLALDTPRRVIAPPLPGPVTPPGPSPTEWTTTAGTATAGIDTNTAVERPVRPVDPPVQPVRRAAEFDSRFARELQPPYPASEERAEREGSVRLQVTIGTTGRVLSATRLAATSDAFWRVTEQQALSRWRFRPATVDGRPVESTKVLTVHFRLDQ